MAVRAVDGLATADSDLEPSGWAAAGGSGWASAVGVTAVVVAVAAESEEQGMEEPLQQQNICQRCRH
jgi:hypothetical protein